MAPSHSEAVMANFRAAPPKAPNPTMPVKTISRFNLTINAKTAKELEITVPPTMRTRRRSNRMNLQLVTIAVGFFGRTPVDSNTSLVDGNREGPIVAL